MAVRRVCVAVALMVAAGSPALAAETTCLVNVVRLMGGGPPVFNEKVRATSTVPKNVVYKWGRNEIEVAWSVKGLMITWDDGSAPGSGYYSGTYGKRFFIHDNKENIAVQVECD